MVKQKSVPSGKNAAVTKARHRAHPWGSLGTGGTGRVHSTSAAAESVLLTREAAKCKPLL